MYEHVIVRYSEIFLKSEYVKKQFENRLVENIRHTLEKQGIEGKIHKKRHKIYIETSEAEKAAEAVSKVYGVASASPAEKTTSELEEIAETGLQIAKKTVREGDRFAARVKRTGKHSYTSLDAEKKIAEKILSEIELKVDLTEPEKTVQAEVTDDYAYVFDRKIKGVGGLPYGTQGKVVALLSSGIDSPLAAWMMMHRGCEVVALNFKTGGEIDAIVEKLEEYTPGKIKTYRVEYEDLLGKIARASGKHTCVICKRAMLKIASRLAEKEKAKGIITGDNLGQVASQTLDNLQVLDEAASPIYRPLIGMDKEEIIARARKIGTYGCKDKKKCPYVPRMPATTSEIGKIKELEEEIGLDELLDGIRWEKK